MKIPLVGPLFRAAGTVAGLLNPVALAASPARRKVAALLLGTGTATGVGGGSYYYVKHYEPAATVAAVENAETTPPKNARGPVQPIPIEAEDDSARIAPPPASAFSGGRFRATDESDNDGSDNHARPSSFGQPRVIAMHDGAIRRANDEQSNDPRDAGTATDEPIADDAAQLGDNDPPGTYAADDRNSPLRGGYAAAGASGNDNGAPPPLTRKAAPLTLSPPPELSPAPSKFPAAREPAPPAASPPAPRSPRNNFGAARLATQDPPAVAARSRQPNMPPARFRGQNNWKVCKRRRSRWKKSRRRKFRLASR